MTTLSDSEYSTYFTTLCVYVFFRVFVISPLSCECVYVCVLVGLSRVYVLMLSFVLSSWAIVGAL